MSEIIVTVESATVGYQPPVQAGVSLTFKTSGGAYQLVRYCIPLDTAKRLRASLDYEISRAERKS